MEHVRDFVPFSCFFVCFCLVQFECIQRKSCKKSPHELLSSKQQTDSVRDEVNKEEHLAAIAEISLGGDQTQS